MASARTIALGGAGLGLLYTASNCLFNVESGKRAIVYNRIGGIKAEVRRSASAWIGTRQGLVSSGQPLASHKVTVASQVGAPQPRSAPRKRFYAAGRASPGSTGVTIASCSSVHRECTLWAGPTEPFRKTLDVSCCHTQQPRGACRRTRRART